MKINLLITVVGAVAAVGVLVLAVLDRRVRLKLTARLDHDGDGYVLRLSVTNNSTFRVIPTFIGIGLKDGSEHQIRERWSHHSPANGNPLSPRGVTWEHDYTLEFRGHDSHKDREDLSRDNLRSFMVDTAHGRKRYEVAIKGLPHRRASRSVKRDNRVSS